MLNPNAIMNIINVAIKLFSHFLDMPEEEFKKVNVPSELKTEIAVARAYKKAHEKFGA